MYYSVTESAGVLKAVIVKKKAGEMSVGIRTIDDTAMDGSDFRAMDKIVTLTETEFIIEI